MASPLLYEGKNNSTFFTVGEDLFRVNYEIEYPRKFLFLRGDPLAHLSITCTDAQLATTKYALPRDFRAGPELKFIEGKVYTVLDDAIHAFNDSHKTKELHKKVDKLRDESVGDESSDLEERINDHPALNEIINKLLIAAGGVTGLSSLTKKELNYRGRNRVLGVDTIFDTCTSFKEANEKIVRGLEDYLIRGLEKIEKSDTMNKDLEFVRGSIRYDPYCNAVSKTYPISTREREILVSHGDEFISSILREVERSNNRPKYLAMGSLLGALGGVIIAEVMRAITGINPPGIIQIAIAGAAVNVGCEYLLTLPLEISKSRKETIQLLNQKEAETFALPEVEAIWQCSKVGYRVELSISWKVRP